MMTFRFPAARGAAVSLAAACLIAPLTASAQTAPVHKHYEVPANAPEPRPGQPLAPRLQNLGVHTFPVTTRQPRAQLFINQGVNLAFGFNHAEAARAFAEAARLDPGLAMAYWGHALVLGPNINAPMDPADEPKALELIRKASSLEAKATPRERDYIQALSARYTGNPADRAQADRAYAEAMRTLVAKHPDDADARTLFAEALMDLRPWNYWTRDGVPYAETVDVQANLERALALNRNHPGALHLWIHLWEPTETPERAEAEADRLLPLMPGAGHIVHMPAHIYQRVGRHADVIASNRLAAKADEDYITQCRAQGLYPLGYYPHNLHFIWMGATAAGQGTLALESARRVVAAIPHEALADVPILQGFLVVPYWAMVRFEKWDDILADKGPDHETAFTKGVWHYARAMAFIGKGQLDAAGRELVELKTQILDPSLSGQTTFSTNSGRAILRIAPEVVAGEIAAARQDWDQATHHLERGIRYEDALMYQEPADWHAPVRQNLGRVLLAAGRPDEAEAVFWEDLRKNPENGWSLSGLLAAQRAQGRREEAAFTAARLKKAWKDADFTPTATAPAASRDGRDVTLKSGLRLHYVEQGPPSGRAVILLHGYTDSSFSFSRVLPLLPSSMRVVALDQRGHGRSDGASDYSMDAMARDVIDTMDALRIPTATLVGHSMGSFVARRAAALAPSRITGLVLMGAAVSPDNSVVRDLERQVNALTDPIDPAFVRAFQDSTVALPVPEAFMSAAVAESRRLDARAWKAVFAGILGYVPAEQTIRVPTLVLGGDKDSVFSEREHRSLAGAIAGARVVMVPGVGHTLHWEQPERFVSELIGFASGSIPVARGR